MTKAELLALFDEADRLRAVAAEAVETPGADWQAASAAFMVAAEKFSDALVQFRAEGGTFDP